MPGMYSEEEFQVAMFHLDPKKRIQQAKKSGPNTMLKTWISLVEHTLELQVKLYIQDFRQTFLLNIMAITF